MRASRQNRRAELVDSAAIIARRGLEAWPPFATVLYLIHVRTSSEQHPRHDVVGRANLPCADKYPFKRVVDFIINACNGGLSVRLK